MEIGGVYLRMRYRVQTKLGKAITIGDVAQVIADESIRRAITRLPLHFITGQDKSVVIMDVMKVIEKVQEYDPTYDIQSIGPAQTIITVHQPKKPLTPIYFVLVWLLLFIGAGFAIMNFHEDVSMRAVHLRIFKLVTGNEEAKPLLLQIPYSIGLGVGMILFFNHFFKKRLSDEPSPLEVEMFNYQQALDQFTIHNEEHKGNK
ncbi:stage V sporulation protein AA [bacterium LRH843]|nr:stage V sporulation protein AA [bacterium LRH843]